MIVGFFLAGFLFISGGVVDYFAKKQWRRITLGDITVWLAIFFGVGVLLNSLFLIPIIKSGSPTMLVNFAQVTGVTTSIGAVVLSILLIIYPRIKRQ